MNAFVAQAAGSKDPHLVVGDKIVGKELKKGTPEGRTYRQAGKRDNYGFSYGVGWKRCQRSVYEDTAEVITDLQSKKEKWDFEEAWPGVAAWQQAFGDRAGHEPEAWFTRTFLNRRRYVSPGKEGKPNYCDGLNGPIQSGGADQLYLALAKMVEDHFEGARVIVTTHDEIVLECPEEVAEEVLGWLLGHMREAVKETIGDELATPDCVEGEAGRSWGS